jgi:hypothetical protein
MQRLTSSAAMVPCRPERDDLLSFSDGRQVKLAPPSLLEQMSYEIVDMQALHDHDNGILGLAVEASMRTWTFRSRGLNVDRRLPRGCGGVAPKIVGAILNGNQPPELTARKLMDDTRLPLDWNEQRRALGFA